MKRIQDFGLLPALYSGAGIALLSAALFGASTPLAKMLLDSVSPWLLAGLLYLGSGLGLALYRLAKRAMTSAAPEEARLHGAQWGWLAAAIMAGGVAGPVLLMLGLTRTTGSAAALLLNLEGVLTALLAWFVFHENFDRRIALGMAAITAGAGVLSWREGFDPQELSGPLLIAAACLAWAIDNNLTRKISLGDPLQIAMLKGCVAGTINVAIAVALGAAWPAFTAVAAAGIVGFLGYGVSMALFVVALRHVGAARTGAYFSLAPFFGALIAIAVFGEAMTAQLLIAGLLMAWGVWLHLTERHIHVHEHSPLAHEHRHVHDAHHRHEHDGSEPPDEPHAHRHVHTRLRHVHTHYPDAHHRHPH